LKAFYEEFANEPKAKLIFKCSCVDDRNVAQQIANMIGQFKGNSKAEVILMTGTHPEEYMTKLYASSDCFVLPTRGEGWGLGDNSVYGLWYTSDNDKLLGPDNLLHVEKHVFD